MTPVTVEDTVDAPPHMPWAHLSSPAAVSSVLAAPLLELSPLSPLPTSLLWARAPSSKGTTGTCSTQAGAAEEGQGRGRRRVVIPSSYHPRELISQLPALHWDNSEAISSQNLRGSPAGLSPNAHSSKLAIKYPLSAFILSWSRSPYLLTWDSGNHLPNKQPVPKALSQGLLWNEPKL